MSIKVSRSNVKGERSCYHETLGVQTTERSHISLDARHTLSHLIDEIHPHWGQAGAESGLPLRGLVAALAAALECVVATS